MRFDAPKLTREFQPRMALRLSLPVILLFLAIPASALAAQAAAGDSLAALPSQVVGVSGSGDQLSLRLKVGAEVRVLKIGDVYADGWTLTGLTPSEATLAKGALSRRVGLSPTSAVGQAAPADDPSQVRTVRGALRTGRGGAPSPVVASEEGQTVDELDQRIAALESSTDPDASETIGYLRIARASLIVSAQP